MSPASLNSHLHFRKPLFLRHACSLSEGNKRKLSGRDACLTYLDSQTEARRGRRDMLAESKAEPGDAIQVFWPKDQTWYDGKVESYDAVSGVCEVLYDDGERQTVNLLKQSKYKCKVKRGVKVVELIDRVRALHGQVSKQLQVIGDALHEISDKLPSAGCCSSRQSWWSDWYSDIKSAVEAGSVIALVSVTWDLACQLRIDPDDPDRPDIVTTTWWHMEGGKYWRGRIRSAKTCEDLVSCVEDLRVKAVDWKKARKLFPNSDISSESESE